MKFVQSLFMISLVLLISGCIREDRYPITGEECGPDDPVRGLDASDCIP